MKNKPPQPQPAGTRRLRPGEIIRRGDVYLRHDGVWIETGTAFIGSEARAGGLEFARRSGPRFSRLV